MNHCREPGGLRAGMVTLSNMVPEVLDASALSGYFDVACDKDVSIRRFIPVNEFRRQIICRHNEAIFDGSS
ncbi:hypothetical protein MH117_02520 [Paenibacillus sp. ACRRX]|uniref:hypothetical protein n=1 Tax=Paenibacillus sp. ACRRX TaxID=2918206 RepID=UPI001EF724FE|nr:hypothetical protein [Paenibacillus sp. ACRRX]MCG7406275.1 hypothetical protein [Paenibacillus sp. ACRRX]